MGVFEGFWLDFFSSSFRFPFFLAPKTCLLGLWLMEGCGTL